jgi:hypothetical protein
VCGGVLYTNGVIVLDTVDREEGLYKPMFESIQTNGLGVDYRPLDAVLDADPNELITLSARYARAGVSGKIPQAIFFIFGTDFLMAPEKSYACSKVLQALHLVAQRPGVLIGLIFPSMQAPEGTNLVSMCARVFNQCGLTTPTGALAYPFGPSHEGNSDDEQIALSVNAFFYMTNIFLSTPLESRSMDFHTTLSLPRRGIEVDIADMKQGLASKKCSLVLLPSYVSCSPAVYKTLPYGIYWYNQQRKNHLFITNNSVLSFAGITENFHVTPLLSGLRLEMLQQIHRMIWEVLYISQAKDRESVEKLLATVDTVATPRPLPATLRNVSFAPEQAALEGRKKTAWMDIDIFAPCSAEDLAKNPAASVERAQQQQDLLANLIASGIDALWITANPHMYYSPIAKFKTPSQLLTYQAMIASFATAVVKAYQAAKLPLPGIYIGFEIANNLYPPYLPQRCAVDLFEKAYPDLPVATDADFWAQEVTGPLRSFLAMWQKNVAKNGLPIAGVVLDLEMYCRKKTGSFTTIMGFDNYTFQRFVSQTRSAWGAVAKRDRSLKLMENKEMRKYYAFLEKEAKAIGTTLKTAFAKMLPKGRIMCYMPSIQISWFYKGLIKGLTSNANPVHLLTFNSEFMAHKPWFDEQKTPVTHACVLMLSKMREVADFDLMMELYLRHKAVWFNRFSRTVEPTSWDWTNIEQLGMPLEERGFFYKAVQELTLQPAAG